VLVLAPPAVQQDVRLLAEVVVEERATVLQGVPSLLRVLVEEEALAQSRGRLRRVFSGGEALTAELAEAWSERTGAQVFNLYGPTETTIDMTVWPYEKAKTYAGQILPLGRPIPNATVYILDARGEPVPAGVAGELHVGGVQLGRGYLNRPELTAEKFIPDGFSGAAGARLYKSGDLVRYWSDGTIEFLGRLDYQVKVRGYRIELGEIEAVLGQHPLVRQTAVVARQYDEGDQRLLAYVSPAPNAAEPSSKELREFLAERLPEYMVPNTFLVLDELPLTPNGKIDRKQLPAPEFDREQLDQAYVAPANAVEETLAAIWQEVLGVDHVGVHDDFFELGGHSLLAIQLMMWLREQLGVEVTL
jgi:acyl-coenzyme A synthetase/AMP-(fatty) acid ligase